jgi:hypothetical protein
VEHRSDQPPRARSLTACAIAGAPISGGVCEVRGRGPMPDAEPVLTAMAQIGLRGTELAATLDALDDSGYDGRPVLKQDTALTADEPAVNSAAMLDATRSLASLNSAHTTEEINR